MNNKLPGDLSATNQRLFVFLFYVKAKLSGSDVFLDLVGKNNPIMEQ